MDLQKKGSPILSGRRLLTKSQKKQAQRRRAFWLITLLVISAIAGGWWLWRNKIADSPRFESLSVRVNQDIRNLLSGETLLLHPDDRVEILSISTNIPFNLNVRLSAEGFDVNALRYETLTLTDLLPQQDPFDRYRFVIHIKHYNRDIGEVIWVVQPYAEDWLHKADRIIDNDRRIALLERGLALLPGNSQINRRLMDEYKALKQWKKAAGMLEKMAGKRDDAALLTELLYLYQEMGDTEAEVKILKELIHLNPNDVGARRLYAEKLEDAKDWNGAIREYVALSRQMKEGDRIEVFKRLGYLYTETQAYEKAIEAYLEAAKLDQKDANLHYNLSYLYEKIGQKEKADFYLDNAVTLKAEDLEGRMKLAHSFVEKGDVKRAREHLSEVLERKPDDMKALGLMAQILEKEGDKKALKTIYQKILSINPREDIILYNLGALEYEAGNLKEALPYFEEYVTSHPEDANAHDILLDIYKRQKDFPSALREAMTMVDLRPTEVDIYDLIVEVMGQQGDYRRMIPLLQNGIKANPRQTTLKKYLVAAYIKTGEEDLAIRQMEEVLREKPQDVRALLQDLFERLRDKKAYDKIIGIMKQAVEADPQEPAFRGYLILAYLETGKEAEAMAQME
ncbi:MAG: hypothetical protein QG552_3014, partial [Thermodesulfobacteriota bacterium]|nr:hypothetical protein [Thermodesulfobacteriota bacterium]